MIVKTWSSETSMFITKWLSKKDFGFVSLPDGREAVLYLKDLTVENPDWYTSFRRMPVEGVIEETPAGLVLKKAHLPFEEEDRIAREQWEEYDEERQRQEYMDMDDL